MRFSSPCRPPLLVLVLTANTYGDTTFFESDSQKLSGNLKSHWIYSAMNFWVCSWEETMFRSSCEEGLVFRGHLFKYRDSTRCALLP